MKKEMNIILGYQQNGNLSNKSSCFEYKTKKTSDLITNASEKFENSLYRLKCLLYLSIRYIMPYFSSLKGYSIRLHLIWKFINNSDIQYIF